MKTLRLLLVGVLFLVVMATTPATAQAADQSVGYLPLISRVDPSLSIRVQSQRALSRIMPKLLALQKDGAILEFEPELNAGVLKIKYSAASALSVLAGVQTYSTIRDAIATIPQGRRSTLGISASGPSFLAELYGSCFEAVNLGASSHVVGSLRDKTGRIVANYEGDADGIGDLFDCFSWDGSFSDVVPGYKLTFKVYDTTPTLLGTYAVFAPSFNFKSFDKAHAIVSGTGPAGKPYYVEWQHANLNASNTGKDVLGDPLTISGAGTWSYDFGATKFRGGDYFSIFVQQSARFAFVRSIYAPSIYCQLGGNYCDISGIPFQPAKLSITHNGITYTFSGKFDACGCFSQVLENNGNPIFLKAGDKLSGTSVAAYTLPNLTAVINFNTDVVSGKAPANRYFELSAIDPCSCKYSIWTNSNSLGNYSGNFASQIDLISTEAINIEVNYQDMATGNITDYYRSVGP